MMRSVAVSFLFILLSSCVGGGTLAPPLVVSAGFGIKSADEESSQALKEVKFAATVPLVGDLADFPKIPVKNSFVVIGFSRILDGSLIETIQSTHNIGEENYKNKIPVVDGYTPVAGLLKIEESLDGNAWSEVDANSYVVSYRPEGGFIPKTDNPVYLNPPPAIRIDLANTKEWTKNYYIRVTLSNKYKDSAADGSAAAYLLFQAES